MTPARWTYMIVQGLFLTFGLLGGLINLIAPDAVTITLNDERVTGMTGFWTALLVGGIVGLSFGLIIAAIVALCTRKKARA